jgi:hypothetical protein
MMKIRYVLWAATLFVVSWALTIISAVVASKGGINHAPTAGDGMDSGAGEMF